MNQMNQLPDDDLLALLMADEAGSEQSIQRATESGPSELSFAQQRLWFLQQLAPQSSAYNLPRAIQLRGALDATVLQVALQHIIDKHDILKTAFLEIDGQPRQVVVPEARLRLALEDLSTLEPTQRSQTLRTRLDAEAGRAFDLSQAPLIRGALLRMAPDEHVLLLNMHHIVSDAWSNPILMQDLGAAYELAGRDAPGCLARPAIQYHDYARWQRRDYPRTPRHDAAAAYWKTYLGEEILPLELPADFLVAPDTRHPAASHSLSLAPELSRNLNAFCQAHGLTPFVVLLGAWQMLLGRYSNQQDFTVGVPNATRNQSETQDLVGFFVSSLIYRAQLDHSLTTLDFLQRLRQESLAALEHSDYPVELIIEDLHVQRRTQANPLFQTLFNWRVAGQQQGPMALGELQLEFLPLEQQEAKFDLALEVEYQPQAIHASLEYSSALFRPQTIERMAQHWQHLLHAIVADASQRIGDLALLDSGEQQANIAAWNPARVEFPATQSIHHLIEQQVERTPEAMAVVFDQQSLSYRQLNQRANRLAHQLIEHGVGPDVLVGLAVERSLEMLIGLLAILKAGGAYVPLDPAYPQERLAYMIEDSGIRLLLTQPSLLKTLPIPDGVRTLLLDTPELAGYSLANPQVAIDPANLAYVIYTSGSTGKPKGTLLPHHNVLRLFQATDRWFSFGPQDVWSLFHSYAFDFSVWEIFGALLYGGKLVVVPHDVSRSPEEFYALLCREGVTVLNQTPSAFKQLMPVACANESGNALRYVVFGGEALEVKALQPWFQRFGDQQPQLINMYGITETTVHVTYRPITLADLQADASSPIGQVIPDLTWYLLDSSLNPVAKGCIGELYVGQAGLARGYLNRGDLTATRFIADPFSTSGERLYRTGDLARYRADGVIEYIGRIDHQVKIRGFRIELGEIEARLLQLPAVREAVVLAMDGANGQQLVGYLVAEPGQLADAELREAIKAQLRTELPDYMVPAHLLFLETLPLTGNGKLDRKALPQPDASLLQQAYVAPQSELEQQIATIWQDVLKLEQVGLTDDFFELGGHSLLATQVVSRVRQSLGLEVALRTLFEHSRLAAFAASLGGTTCAGEPPLKRVERNKPLPLSYAQERQLFLWQFYPESNAYHIPAAIRMRGELDIQALQYSLNALLARHESLRTTFVEQGEHSVQVIADHALLGLSVDQRPLQPLSPKQIEDCIEHETRKPFNLAQGPLLRARLVPMADDDYLLLLTQHHIVSDGWSTQVMVQELIELYAANTEQRAPNLPELPIQYADYAVWQRQWMEAGERERQLAYWVGQLGGEQKTLELPTDHPRPARQSFRGAKIDVPLSAALSQGLKALAQREGVTPFMLLLASFQILLHRYSGQTDIRVGAPIANRNRVETERLIGFFVNTLVLKSELNGLMPVTQLLAQVKQTALDAQSHQDLPFEQLVEALQPERTLSQNPLFQVLFNHHSEQLQQRTERPLPNLQLESLEADSLSAKFDLALDTFDSSEGLHAVLTYAADLFAPSTVERMARHWQNLLQAMVSAPEQAISDLAMIDAGEQQRMVNHWNATAVDNALERAIHQLIEDQVDRTPDAPALAFASEQLSYRQLNQRANQLAHKLIEQGVGPDVRVGIALERSVEMIVGLLAVLKAGGAYVPLDPAYPEDRLFYMMQDSGLRLLLTQRALREQLPIPEGVQSLELDQDLSWLEGYGTANPTRHLSPENLAYVIYTSGSTGKPKGVMVRHGALNNFISSMARAPGLANSDCMMSLTTFSFDIFGLEIYLPLKVGARIVLSGQGMNLDPQAILDSVQRQGVTALQATPSTWRMLLDHPHHEALRNCKLLCGGEALPEELAARMLGLSAQVWNLYGPTETTIWSAVYPLSPQQPAPYLGHPIDNTSLYIVDPYLATAPVGAAGELLIGGDGLARGYFQRPALTAERFLPDPFGPPGARVYRTGDLARYRQDGVIEYLSRIDHQVKIRGFRIELGEIESRVLELDEVREVAVVAHDTHAGPQLVGYVVAVEPPAVAEHPALHQKLKAWLGESLPDYMVPAHWVVVEKLPLTPNGKLDRKALPALDISLLQRTYVAPHSELEKQLAAIWASILNVESIGLNDNFFELGGHSLLAVRVVSRVQLELGMQMSAQQMFQAPTLGALASELQQSGNPIDALKLSKLEALFDEMEEV